MTKNQCLESLSQLSEAVEKFAHACGLDGMELNLEKHASDLSYAVSNWLIGEEVSARLNAASEQTARCTLRVEEMKQQLMELNQQLEEKNLRLQKLEAQAASLSDQLKQADASTRRLISQMIAMRDSLLARTDLLRENGVEETDERFKVVASSLRDTARLLQGMGVTILEDEGLFDAARHTIVETIPTDDPVLANHIVRVFRPGYLYEGQPLRGQEVIIYVKD